MVRVKVCGLTSESDRRAAVDAGADAVGVISEVSVETPRAVSRERARDLVAGTPPFVTTVLVTMPADADEAVDLVRAVAPDVLQVHGDLSASALDRIRAETGVRVVPVLSCDESDRARELAPVADALLVDSKSADGGGGTGRTHDWEATRTLARAVDVPVILAGGLTPENVAEAVATVSPFAVDVASGVEREGGVKDHDAVSAFVRAATRREVSA